MQPPLAAERLHCFDGLVSLGHEDGGTCPAFFLGEIFWGIFRGWCIGGGSLHRSREQADRWGVFEGDQKAAALKEKARQPTLQNGIERWASWWGR